MPIVRPRSEAVERETAPSARARAQIALGLRKRRTASSVSADRGVGGLGVEHAGRVGDDDPVLARPGGVDMVVADAEAGDDLQLRQLRHQVAVDLRGRGRRRRAREWSARSAPAPPPVGLEPEPVQRRARSIRSAILHALGRHQNIEVRHAPPLMSKSLRDRAPSPWRADGRSTSSRRAIAAALPHAGRRLDMARRAATWPAPMHVRSPDPPAAPPALARRLMLRDFRSYAALDMRFRAAADRVLRGENGAGKTNLLEALSLFSPGRGLRRAELAELRAASAARGGFAVSVEVEEDGERRQLGVGWSPAGADGAAERRQPHRPRARRLGARLHRPCPARLADAGDGLAVRRPGRASGDASSTGSCWRSIRSHGARVNAFERALARPQPAARGGRAQRRLARRGRARGGRTRRRRSPRRGSNACAGSRR